MSSKDSATSFDEIRLKVKKVVLSTRSHQAIEHYLQLLEKKLESFRHATQQPFLNPYYPATESPTRA